MSVYKVRFVHRWPPETVHHATIALIGSFYADHATFLPTLATTSPNFKSYQPSKAYLNL